MQIEVDHGLLEEFLDLRFTILRNRENWRLIGINSPQDTLDEYDSHSIILGVRDGANLIAAVRIVTGLVFDQIPSSRFLQTEDVKLHPSQLAEISRLMVLKEYRHHGLAKLLTMRSIAEAKRRKIMNIFITIQDTVSHCKYLNTIGFRLLKNSFSYGDSTITANEFAATFQLDINETPYNLPYKLQMDKINVNNILLTTANK